MRIRFAKVRTTDHRPPGAAGKPPLEAARLTRGGSMTGLDYLTASQQREAAEHDRNVAGLPPETLDAAYRDLRDRKAYDPKDPEHRWIKARRAALLREAAKLKAAGYQP